MNKKIVLVIIILGLGLVVAGLIRSQSPAEKSVEAEKSSAELTDPHASHSSRPARVPAFQTAAASRDLGPTLAPDNFSGKTRDAYRVAKKIPATLAQLPVMRVRIADMGTRV